MKLSDVKGIGPKTETLLNKIGIFSFDDLVTHYPFRYEILKRSNLKDEETLEKVIIDGKVESIPILVRFKGNLNKLNIRLATKDGVVGVSIFNRAFLKPNLKIGTSIIAIGKYDKQRNILTASEIKFGSLSNKETIEPVYHTTSGITGKVLASYINNALLKYGNQITDNIPKYLLDRYNFNNKKTDLNIVHNPPDFEKLKESMIRLKYEELFELTKRACNVLSKNLDCFILDAEVAYLTLHFGAFMPTQKANKHAFRIMIICPNGIGTGNMLRQEVSTLVPQATEIKNIPLSSYRPNHDYDVVISTVMLANEQRLIMVHPILTDQDRVAILRNCMATEPQAKMQIDDILKIASNYINPDQLNDFHKNLQDYYSSIQVQKVPHKTYDRGLLDFLKGSHIQCVNSQVSWEEAIHISAQPLLDDGSISNDYVNAIINDQKNKGLYMFLADDLVLAHSAIENGVNRLDVSMCTFKEPVPFLNGQNARIILVLCAEDKTKHIRVLNDMLNIFSKKKSIDQIASLNSPAEIYSYIDKHIEK